MVRLPAGIEGGDFGFFDLKDGLEAVLAGIWGVKAAVALSDGVHLAEEEPGGVVRMGEHGEGGVGVWSGFLRY